MVGPDAYPAQIVGGGSARAAAFAPVSVLQGIGNFLGASSTVYYERGLPTMTGLARSTEFMTAPQNGERGVKVEVFANADLSGTPKSTADCCITSTLHGTELGELRRRLRSRSRPLRFRQKNRLSRRWTGYYIAAENGPYEVALQGGGEGNGNRLYVDDKLVIDNWKIARALQPHVTLELSAGPHKVVVEDFQHSAVRRHVCASASPISISWSASRQGVLPPKQTWSSSPLDSTPTANPKALTAPSTCPLARKN